MGPAEAVVRSEDSDLTRAGRRWRTPSRKSTASRMSHPRTGPNQRVPNVKTAPARNEPATGTTIRHHRGACATAWTRFGSAGQISRGKRVARKRKTIAPLPDKIPTATAPRITLGCPMVRKRPLTSVTSTAQFYYAIVTSQKHLVFPQSTAWPAKETARAQKKK